ncbi:unnamed protein product [marine sediment metagenome]|uniref:Uncharacterized protein n=1 Tax=marine sediment metagenome TaxID=412755 RepID=X0SEV8_9ZZZZ
MAGLNKEPVTLRRLQEIFANHSDVFDRDLIRRVAEVPDHNWSRLIQELLVMVGVTSSLLSQEEKVEGLQMLGFRGSNAECLRKLRKLPKLTTAELKKNLHAIISKFS